MNLRRRSRLVALVSVLIFLVPLGLFLFAYRGKLQTQRDLAVAESLSVQTTQLRTALFGYLLHPQAELRGQVEAQFAVLTGLLGRLGPAIDASIRDDAQTRYAWETVRRLVGDAQTLFAQLGDAGTDQGRTERDARTSDLILVDSHSLILFVNQIRYRANARFLRATTWENLTLGGLLTGIAGLGLVLFLVFVRVILKPVQQLHEAAVRVAGGDLGLRLASPRRDEFGALAGAFDGMLDRLQETMVSRARLEAEIAERVRTEAALTASEAALRNAQRLAGLGSWSWDLKSGVQTWSEEIFHLYGRDPRLGPAAYPQIRQYFTPASWERLAAAVERARTDGLHYECEAELVRPDGRPGWIVARGEATRDAAGTIVRLSGTVQEITASKLAEQEIQSLNAELERRVEQRTAELQAANRELESFAYAVSHDLRAPLRALSGFSQALVEDYGERLDGEARSFLDQIQGASRRMGELIDGILTLSRSTRGELRRDPVDLSAQAQGLLAQRAAAEPGRQVAWEVAPGLCVLGDASMLEVVMVNLIDNAWKYTARMPTATIRVYAEERAGEFWYVVADNGAGFDMAYRARLFQPFQRLHRQDEFPGIGIGLATVQRIIHRHGGTIEAEGVPGGGATFRFTVPATGRRPESLCKAAPS